jgi:hypothetical protein
MVLAAEELRMPRSAVRSPKGGYTGNQAWQEEPKVKRASRNQTQGTMSTRVEQRQTVAPNTGQDTQIAPGIRTGTKVQPVESEKPPRHPLVYIGSTIIAMLAIWWLTTAAWGWIIVHTSDAVTYGPTHGTTITAVIGGGDSADHPTTLIAMNNKGSVQIIKILANDPSKAQLLVITDLAVAGVPDPTNAAIELKDRRDHIDMTIHTTVWDMPFHRVERTFTLAEDGQGSLKLLGG